MVFPRDVVTADVHGNALQHAEVYSRVPVGTFDFKGQTVEIRTPVQAAIKVDGLDEAAG